MVKKKGKRRISRKKAVVGGAFAALLMGLGAGAATEKISSNLGADLGGLQEVVPAAAAWAVGGPLAGVGQLIMGRLPTFFGDQSTSVREGV